jgi:uncharacterized protein
MRKTVFFTFVCLCSATGVSSAADVMKVVILTGNNNHQWSETTPVLKRGLEQTGRFKVDVIQEPEELTAKLLSRCEVLLSNWNNWRGRKGKEPAAWSDQLRKAYVAFVKNGGGHVMIHAGSSSFFDWPDYQKICGATWQLGQTRHGPVHEFDVRITETKHVITEGLKGFRPTDELWARPGIQPNVEILAEAYSEITKGWEPSVMVSQFGKGRCFTLMLGHAAEHMQTADFQTLLVRGTEWAASGKVTADGDGSL